MVVDSEFFHRPGTSQVDGSHGQLQFRGDRAACLALAKQAQHAAFLGREQADQPALLALLAEFVAAEAIQMQGVLDGLPGLLLVERLLQEIGMPACIARTTIGTVACAARNTTGREAPMAARRRWISRPPRSASRSSVTRHPGRETSYEARNSRPEKNPSNRRFMPPARRNTWSCVSRSLSQRKTVEACCRCLVMPLPASGTVPYSGFPP